MAFAAWAEENPSKIYQNPPWALAGRPQIAPELAGRAPDLRNLGNPRKTLGGGKSVPPGQETEKNIFGQMRGFEIPDSVTC